MKQIVKYILGVMTILTAVSCMKDGDMLIASLENKTGTDIMTFDDDIVLLKDNASNLALTLYWNEVGDILLNRPDVALPSGVGIYAVQFSGNEDFSETEEIAVDKDESSLQLTVMELNGMLARLGFEADLEAPLYIRLRTALGDNTTSVYGASVEVTVTPYFIDWSYVTLIPKGDKDSSLGTLSATGVLGDGEYAGYVTVVNSWVNFCFMESDGTFYGHKNDGSAEDIFVLAETKNITEWNCWFTEGKGEEDTDSYACWYVTMSRSGRAWTGTRVRGISAVYGEMESNMSLDGEKEAYVCVIETTEDNVSVQLDGTGTYYDKDTKQANPKSTSFAIIANADNTLSTGNSGESTGLTIPSAGTYTLYLYLDEMKWELKEGSEVTEPDPVETKKLYGYWTWPNGGWVELDMASVLVRTDGDYAGYVSAYDAELHANVTLFKEEITAGGNNYNIGGIGCLSNNQSTLGECDNSSYWALWFSTGLHRVTVDPEVSEWSSETLTPYIAGSHNEWTFAPLTQNNGKWSADVTLEAGATFKLVLSKGNGDWTYEYSGTDGVLHTANGGNDNMYVSEAGTYTFEVDLTDASNLTYTLTAK